MTNYRCRLHHEQEVTPRGTGCPECEYEKRPPRSWRRSTTYRERIALDLQAQEIQP